jgi:MFS family permease
MTTQSARAGHPADGVPRRRIVTASMVGTTVEFYDFYIYATAAVTVFPFLFFPKGNPTTALLASLATFGLAFVARPLGSILFGHFGDRVGRKATLVGSLLTMGIATVAIGLLPTYHQVGILAPALLALMRFTQGLALGGEWSGAALLAVETARPGRRAWAAMWPQLGAPLGFLLANGAFLVLLVWLRHSNTDPDLDGAFLTWGWRLPFLFSAVMVVIGLYVRLRLAETPVFARAVERGERVRTPVAQVFRSSWRQLVTGTFVMVATYTLFYVVTTWAPELRHRQTTAGRLRSGVQLLRLPAAATGGGAVLRGAGSGLRPTGRPLGAPAAVAGGHRRDHGLRGLLRGPARPVAQFGRDRAAVPGDRHGADGPDLRTDECGAARTLPDQRPLHRLGNRLQRREHPRRCGGPVHRDLAVDPVRRRLGRCVPRDRCGRDVCRAAVDAGHPRRLPGFGMTQGGPPSTRRIEPVV